mmetsp:Transcript_5745/g.16402  ORF Transcript_5745/g.16402 Transcript_5745/m.16402 type:complete len:331 (+) Transcript_5745:141-1133(+)
MYIGRRWLLLASILIALARFESAEGSRLKKARRSIENPDEEASETTEQRRRLTLADDVFTTTSREFEVTGYHRHVGEIIVQVVKKFSKNLFSLFKFTTKQWRRVVNNSLGRFIGMLQSVQSRNEAALQDAEVAPAPTISIIYDSLSNVMSPSPPEAKPAAVPATEQQTKEPTPNKQQPTTMQTPTNNIQQEDTTNSAPLRNIPKATSTKRVLNNKKSADLGTSGSSFEAMKSAAISASEEENGVVPSTSVLAGLLPTLVAGLVFTTAGSMVGYLWNGEWTETASSVYDYFWGDETAEPSYESDIYTVATPEYGREYEYSSSKAVPVTPDR